MLDDFPVQCSFFVGLLMLGLWCGWLDYRVYTQKKGPLDD